MITIPNWLLPLLLFAVWSLWALAAIAELRAKELREGVAKELRGGVSVVPVLPLFPLGFWGAAALVDVWAGPWGTVVIGALHLLLALAMVFTLVRDLRYCLGRERT